MYERFLRGFGFDDDELRSFKRMHANAIALGFGEVAATMLAAYATGSSAKQVAYAMKRAESTVRWHIKDAYRRLHLNDKAHLAITLVDPPRA